MSTSHTLASYVSILSHCPMQGKQDCPMDSHGYLTYTCILHVRPLLLSYIGQAGLSHEIPWVPTIHLDPTCLSSPTVLHRTSGTVPRNPMGTSHTLAFYVSVLSHCPMQDKWDCATKFHGYLQYTCILCVRPVPLSYVGQARLSHGTP